MVEVSQFIGPLGGLLCIAWAMGAIAGYAFHNKFILSLHQKVCDARVKALEESSELLKTRIAVLEERLQLKTWNEQLRVINDLTKDDEDRGHGHNQ